MDPIVVARSCRDAVGHVFNVRTMQRMAMAAMACSACGTLVDSDYAGEPLLRLQGVASSARRPGVTTSGVRGAVLWQGVDVAGMVGFTRLPLAFEFPAFWIDILALPGEAAALRLDPGEPVIAEAYLHIVKPGTGAAPRADDFLATDYDHVLVHVDGACAPDGMAARYLGAALEPGFHVMVRTSVAELSAPQQVLVDQCVARATTLPAARARTSCTEQHRYQLAPAPDDLETILQFRVSGP